ncbi:hypothetical protein KC099_14715 [Acinetobacter nosocomialis]|uniref:hypothetical protein n=1 Tax=Acinetobacter nosocomialis TaxID=106654 RepID=UPI001B81113D|nr:hypothetical protein [Acinetobacter nosocomialis]MBR7714431.1 hypothetical protein [Acinetobacter nosocomialis]
MKPEQFIRDFGVEKAREVVEGAPDEAWKYISGWHNRYGDEVKDWGVFKPQYEAYHPDASSSNAGRFDAQMRQLECVDLSDLKRLVESLDLIEKFGGIKRAKELLKLFEDRKGRTDNYMPLFRAVQDHESIYGGGDE